LLAWKLKFGYLPGGDSMRAHQFAEGRGRQPGRTPDFTPLSPQRPAVPQQFQVGSNDEEQYPQRRISFLSKPRRTAAAA
jgi:hypothetical protein